MTGPQRKRLVSIFTFGTLLTALTVAADYGTALERLERALYDIRVRHCQWFAKPPTDKLAQMDIDDGALAQVGRWPWPRALMADIVDELDAAGAELIVFDVLFAEPVEPEIVRDRRTGEVRTI